MIPLELLKVSFSYSGHVILRDVSLRVEHDDYLLLLGSNGSGKTTLLKVALGLLPPSSGEARLFGVAADDPKARSRVGYVPQRSAISPRVPATVAEVVCAGRAGRSVRGGFSRADREAARMALERVGLEGSMRTRIGALSGGQQQRVLIARALANEPALLILDEPTAGVDRESQVRFAGVLKDLHAQGVAIVVVAHDLGAIGRDVGRVVALHQGHLDEIGIEEARAQVGMFVEDHPA